MADAPPVAETVDEETRDRGRLARHAKKIANYHVLLAGAIEDMDFQEEGEASDSGPDEHERSSQADTAPGEHASSGPQRPLRVFDLPPEFRQQPSCYVPHCNARFDRYRPDLKPALWVRTCLSHSRPHITPGACAVCNEGPNSSTFFWVNDTVRLALCTACSTRLEGQIKHFVGPTLSDKKSAQHAREGTQTVEEGGLMFTFADAPDKIDPEKPVPPSKGKGHHSPPPLRALKSAPDTVPKRRRVGPVTPIGKAEEEDAAESGPSAPATKSPLSRNRGASASDDPVRALQNYIQLVRKWESDGALGAGLPEFVVDQFYATQPAHALQAVLSLGAADSSVLPWVSNTLSRWRQLGMHIVQPKS